MIKHSCRQDGNSRSQNQLKLNLKSYTWSLSTRSRQALTLPDTWLGCLLLWEVWSTNHENRTFRWTLTSPITSSQLGQNEPTASKRLYYGLTAYWLIMADSHLISHQIKILLDDSVFPNHQPPAEPPTHKVWHAIGEYRQWGNLGNRDCSLLRQHHYQYRRHHLDYHTSGTTWTTVIKNIYHLHWNSTDPDMTWLVGASYRFGFTCQPAKYN